VKLRIFGFLLIVIFAIGACNGSGEEHKNDSAASCKTKSLNPNGDSELAILMREMAVSTDSVKQDLLNHKTVRPFPDFSAILTAKKTDESIDKDIFTPLAQNYLNRVKDFSDRKSNNGEMELYNDMVDACINCHKNFCGGPIKRIQKLYIPQN
jgi:hypothetical protein